MTQESTDFRNYFELKPGAPWYRPEYFCCAFVEMGEHYGEEMLSEKGITPYITNRLETDDYDSDTALCVITCRIKKEEVEAFKEVMERLKVKQTIKSDWHYKFFCESIEKNIVGDDLLKETYEARNPGAFSVVK